MVECDNCGNLCEEALDKGRIDFGWELDTSLFGFYGGFSDCCGDDKSEVWNLCHDCVVSILNAFPKLAEKWSWGGHPSMYDDRPCCRWAWGSSPDGKLLKPNVNCDGWEEVK